MRGKWSAFAAAALSLLIAGRATVAAAQGDNNPPGKPECSLSIPFRVDDSKGWIPEGTMFTVQMTASEGTPLPDKTAYEVDVTGEYIFGPIVFDEPGDYLYTVSEVKYDSEKIIFDETVYNILATVIWNDDGELVGGFGLTKEGSTVKPEYVLFDNGYTDAPPDESSEPDSEGDDSTSSEPDSEGDDSTSSEPDSEGDDSTSSEPDSEGDDSTTSEPDSEGDDSTTSEPDSGDGDSTSSEPDSGDDESKPPDNDSSSKGGGETSKSSTPQDNTTTPFTGSAVTIGITGAAFAILILTVLSKRRDDGGDNDDPPDGSRGDSG